MTSLKSVSTAFSLLTVVSVFSACLTAKADEAFDKKHPRRAQVLNRDRKLRNKTENAEKSGKITQGQANRLEKEESAIHQQERADAAANGGHITKSEQRDLNREEKGVDRRLHNDELKDAGSANSATPPTQ